MKRVKAACICQTLHFMLKEDISHEDAVRFVAEEVAHSLSMTRSLMGRMSLLRVMRSIMISMM